MKLKLVIRSAQVDDAGLQAVAAAWAWCRSRPTIHTYTATAPRNATAPPSAIRCCRQVTQAILRHGTGRRLSSSSRREDTGNVVISSPPTVRQGGHARVRAALLRRAGAGRPG